MSSLPLIVEPAARPYNGPSVHLNPRLSLLGAGLVVFALGLCAAVPAVVVALRGRSARRTATPEL